MKKVLVFGTFDVIHPGHEFFLKEAALLGDHLTAVVSLDRFIKSYKKQNPVHNEEERIHHLISSRLVDEAVPADLEMGTYLIITKLNPDVICLGHDQTALKKNLELWLKRQNRSLDIVIIDPYKRNIYSSTLRNSR